MILTTTGTIEGRQVAEYRGVVFGEVITGINIIKDMGAGLRNVFGGRSKGYEEELLTARDQALEEISQRASQLGCDAVIGLKMDYESLGQGGMLMVTCSGTAVKLK